MKIFENLVVGREGSARERGGSGTRKWGGLGDKSKAEFEKWVKFNAGSFDFLPEILAREKEAFRRKMEKSEKSIFFFT